MTLVRIDDSILFTHMHYRWRNQFSAQQSPSSDYFYKTNTKGTGLKQFQKNKLAINNFLLSANEKMRCIYIRVVQADHMGRVVI